MENIIKKIKEELKSQAIEQRFVKSQRKTKYLVGERKIQSIDAQNMVINNKHELIIEYIAYYILKHKMDEPVIVKDSDTFSINCSNMESVKEAIKMCCGEKCYILKDKYYFEYSAVKVARKIQEWKEKYKKDESVESLRRLYVLIDKNLDSVYGCVQGGHAVAQYLLEHKNGWKNQYLIYLKADIEKWFYKLENLGLDFSFFREPDICNKMTAIAIESDGKLFKNLKLVK